MKRFRNKIWRNMRGAGSSGVCHRETAEPSLQRNKSNNHGRDLVEPEPHIVEVVGKHFRINDFSFADFPLAQVANTAPFFLDDAH